MSTAAGPAVVRPAGRLPGRLQLVAAVVLLAAAVLAGLGLGATIIAPHRALGALLSFDGSATDVAVVEVRLPRLVVGFVVGGALGVAGAIMQALARNALAEPSLLGVSWGAALAAVAGQVVLGIGSAAALVPLAMGGAAVAGVVVVALAVLARDAMAPERLVVAGAAISGLLAAIVQGILVVDRESLEVARRWLAGSLLGADWSALTAALPYLGAGALLAVALARPLGVLSMGDDVARGLGVPVTAVKLGAAAAVVALAGTSVALAGPVVLVGLAVPHVARRVCGPDLGPQLAGCVVLGGVLVVISDAVARVLAAPEELPVGVVTAFVGAPFLLRAARRGGARE